MPITKEAGYVYSIYSGVAKVTGLPHVFQHEVLIGSDKKPAALVVGFNKKFVNAIFFDENFDINQPLYRSHEEFSINVSKDSIGRVVDGLGRPLDGRGVLRGDKKTVFQSAPPIIDRQQVTQPLTTGIKAVDATLPLGRGQRELIIGDRKLGKTTVALDTVLNQKLAKDPVICVYVIIGQNKKELSDLLTQLKANACLTYSLVVAATARESYASLYLAPFVGCTLAEFFRNSGQDALVVYDDLSKHAKVFRDIALLQERSPGRETYPGDVFSLHAGLLERAAKLSDEKGGGSLTALPIIETLEGDITGFIPTNLISITDGQIYFERGLFQKGFLPAINIGLSVSRLGSQVQPAALKEVTLGLRLSLSQHRELQKLSQLETVVSQKTQSQIHRGNLILEILKQAPHTLYSWPEQTILFYAVEEGFFDDLSEDDWPKLQQIILDLTKYKFPDLLESIENKEFNDSLKNEIKDMITKFKNDFIGTNA